MAPSLHSPPACTQKRLRRLRGHSYAGFARYSLTFCTRQRRSVFTNARLVDLALMQILRSATAGGFEVIAYCAMPDHLHLLVEATAETASLPEFVKGANADYPISSLAFQKQ